MEIKEYAEKYTCGSCKHFRFEGEREKGKCAKFNAYYWPYDNCKNNWEEAPDWYRDKRPINK